MQPCPGNGVAIGRLVIYNVWDAQAFSAGIECRHCILQTSLDSDADADGNCAKNNVSPERWET